MILREEKMDLFEVPQGYYLANSISGDFNMSAGVIAKRFDEVYNMEEKLNNFHGHAKLNASGAALLVDNVFNLVIKNKSHHKASSDVLTECLKDMRTQMKENLITKVAMPQIGCGHNGLSWDSVKEIIEEVFDGADVEILVCLL